MKQQPSTEYHNVVIIGAGGAGLATSHFLTQVGVKHIVLERGQVGNTWATERWDSFHLVNPNWAVQLPSYHYQGDNPDGFLSRDEVVTYLQAYANHIHAPVRTGVEVTALCRQDHHYQLMLDNGPIITCNIVVVATGAFGPPKIPDFASELSEAILQLHSAHYKNPNQLPSGGILVVGSGQSGAQIAEDLHDAGRQVYLSVSSAGRRPRRYRGRDSSWWKRELGQFDLNMDNIDAAARARKMKGDSASGHVSGSKGGHDIFLRALCRDGMTLLGSTIAAKGDTVCFAQNLLENLRLADEAAISFKKAADAHIARTGMDAPADDNPDPPGLDAWPAGNGPTQLNLITEGIASIVWATGFRYEYSWIKLPVENERGYPIQWRGVSQWPGLYFMGLHWMYGSKSAQFIGVHEDAKFIAEQIVTLIEQNQYRQEENP